MKICLGFVIVEIFLVMCHSYTPVSKGSNYLHFLKTQKFKQIKSKNPILYQQFSENLDELDAYEEQELEQKQNQNHIKDNILDNNLDKLEFKNIKTKLENKEIEYDIHNSIGNQRSCTISESGLLDVSINEENIFNIKKYFVQIASSYILITENESSKDIIKQIPFENIKLPIETIEETRECWKLKTTKENIMFCEKNKQDRDIWIQNILKALFCYNTNNLKIQKNLFERNEKIQLPKESTIEKRIQEKKNQSILENKKQHMGSKHFNRNNDYKSEDITDLDLDMDLNINQ